MKKRLRRKRNKYNKEFAFKMAALIIDNAVLKSRLMVMQSMPVHKCNCKGGIVPEYRGDNVELKVNTDYLNESQQVKIKDLLNGDEVNGDTKDNIKK